MKTENQKAADFIMTLGKAYHTYGASANRLEDALILVSRELNVKSEFFTTPTSLFASFKFNDEEFTRLLRVHPGGVNLDKLGQVDEIADSVLEGRKDIETGLRLLEQVEVQENRHSRAIMAISYGVASGSVGCLLGRSFADVGISLIFGLFLGIVSQWVEENDFNNEIFDPMVALIISFLAPQFLHVLPHISVPSIIVSSLIILIPGLGITLSLAELSANHLVAGSCRLFGAATTLFKIILGIALGTKLAGFDSSLELLPPMTLPQGIKIPALLFAAWSFTVIFRSGKTHTIPMIIAALFGHWSGQWGQMLLGPQLGSFLGGLCIGLGSNFYARMKHRPATITVLPGIILLVPGVIGHKALTFFLGNQVVTAMNEVFTMFVMAGSIVGGLLFANLIYSSRRIL